MKSLNGSSCRLAACLVVLLAQSRVAQGAQPALASYILPSSAYLTGANAAEYQTNVRILNQGASAVTVTATFYDQRTSTTFSASVRGHRERNVDRLRLQQRRDHLERRQPLRRHLQRQRNRVPIG